ncbi:four-carbon acid sugar kinase family protein [Salibacterium lacus]|uniref:Four-carbon acid sugar kinase family protein n=1 Tax=Salibacterium lacus TaxID=1898109 RepID=A0ABW5T4J9_9BACI
MKLSILADDLTGAGDSGVQIIKYGMTPFVIIQEPEEKEKDSVYIYNTDSRTMTANDSYQTMKDYCSRIEHTEETIIYKKIDSTMRGNIGRENNALYDYFTPDFVITAPAHPSNGRTVKNRMLYLHDILLHETEVARDPKTPVQHSDINRIIQEQSDRETAHIYLEDLRAGKTRMLEIFQMCKDQNIHHITADATVESDLADLAAFVESTSYSVIWGGSAGLIYHLPAVYGHEEKHYHVRQIPEGNGAAVFVVGSMSAQGRNQLRFLLQDETVKGLQIQSAEIAASAERRMEEYERIRLEAAHAAEKGFHLAFYSSDNVAEAVQNGRNAGLSSIEVSDLISRFLGETAAAVVEELQLERLFLTGGDTALQVMENLGAEIFELLDEIEPGVPIGKLPVRSNMFAVTKAGNFGKETIMQTALKRLNTKHGTEKERR